MRRPRRQRRRRRDRPRRPAAAAAPSTPASTTPPRRRRRRRWRRRRRRRPARARAPRPSGGGKKGKTAPDGGLFGQKAPKGGKGAAEAEREKIEEPPLRNPDGSPAQNNPGLTIAQFGPAPIGVPNFVIDQFEIPPFLLPIYQACGTEYGIPWQVLASINRIETAFGTNLNVSSAGAMGWMQFIPSSWRAYGVDANEDGRKDPYNPVDAICAAARYLRGRRRRGATCATRSSPTTTPTGTSTRSCSTPTSTASSPTTWSAR